MKQKDAGLRINHGHSAVVFILDVGEEIKQRKLDREGKRDRYLDEPFDQYYDKVIASLVDTSSILMLDSNEGSIRRHFQGQH